MKGEELPVSSLSSCDPIITIDDLGISKTVDGTTLNGSDAANPCGLVAKSFFNDSYSLYNGSTSASNRLAINENNIAWESDVEYKFKNNENWQST